MSEMGAFHEAMGWIRGFSAEDAESPAIARMRQVCGTPERCREMDYADIIAGWRETLMTAQEIEAHRKEKEPKP